MPRSSARANDATHSHGRNACRCGRGLHLPYALYAAGRGRSGYSDVTIEDNRFKVSFEGNSATDRETVELYTLYRAAEVAKAHGYDYFIMAEPEVEKDVRLYSFPSTYRIHYFGGIHHLHDFPFIHSVGVVYDSGTRTITRYRAFANIVAYRGEKPVGDPNAYDVDAVIENLAPRIIRPAMVE